MKQERQHFTHEPSGGVGTTGEPSAPHWSKPSYDVKREPDGTLTLLPKYYADDPPMIMPKRREGESNGDYFLRCLDVPEE